MKNNKKTNDNINYEGKKIIFISFLLSLICLMNITTIITQAIPMHVSLFMLTLPIMIYFGINIHENVNKFDKIEMAKLLTKQKQRKCITFRIYYKPTADGTLWEIRNIDKHKWEHPKCFIEQINKDKSKKVDKYDIEEINNDQAIIIRSKLKDNVGVKWRTMIATPYNYKIEIPSKWIKNDRDEE
jgi:hypothetical protein